MKQLVCSQCKRIFKQHNLVKLIKLSKVKDKLCKKCCSKLIRSKPGKSMHKAKDKSRSKARPKPELRLVKPNKPLVKTEIIKNDHTETAIIIVEESDNDYKLIRSLFNSTNQILRVEKSINYQLLTCFQQAKQELNIDDHIYLFHGSDNVNYDDIIRYGFDIGCSKLTGLLGQGIYFSSSATYSDTFSWPIETIEHGSIKVMLLSRVLLGKTTTGKTGLTKCPDGYQSVTNNRNNYAIFNSAQAYPEYLIYYKVKVNVNVKAN